MSVRARARWEAKAGGAGAGGAQGRREKVAEQVYESPALNDDAHHCPPVQHQADAAEKARGALGLPLLEKESVRLRWTNDEHDAREEEQLRKNEREASQPERTKHEGAARCTVREPSVLLLRTCQPNRCGGCERALW